MIVSAWTPSAQEREPSAKTQTFEENCSTSIRRQIKANTSTTKKVFEVVAKELGCVILAFGESKFTDVPMTVLVEWPLGQEGKVGELEQVAIVTPFGDFYVTGNGSNV